MHNPLLLFSSLCYLKVDQLGNVGVSNEHLMQQTTDETLHLPQVTEQASLWLGVLPAPPGSLPQASLFRFPWQGAPNAPQQALCVGPQLLLFGGWQTHLQENLDCCAVLVLNRNRWLPRLGVKGHLLHICFYVISCHFISTFMSSGKK